MNSHLEAPWSGAFIAIPSLRPVLADAKGPGSELRAQGRWEADKAQVQLELDQVQAARLDAHLGAWLVSGPLRAEFDRLPTPASLWAASAASATAAWSAHVTGKLAGTAPALGSVKNAVVPPPMTLQLDALARADSMQLARFNLKAGAASLGAGGALARDRRDRWQGELHAQWSQLDPGARWRLADSGALRDGPNSLNGSVSLRVADAPAAWQGLAGVHARADLVLADSVLAGLALDGKASVDALAAPWKVSAELHSGGNQAQVAGALRPGRAGDDALAVIGQLHLSLDAPSLQLLAAASVRTKLATPAAGSAVDGLAETRTIPGAPIAKVATGGKSDDPKALAPAVAASAARAADPATASGRWFTRRLAMLDIRVTRPNLEIVVGVAITAPGWRRTSS